MVSPGDASETHIIRTIVVFNQPRAARHTRKSRLQDDARLAHHFATLTFS
jgi:hypothetical protein